MRPWYILGTEGKYNEYPIEFLLIEEGPPFS
jgi:uncharacterized membrane protein